MRHLKGEVKRSVDNIMIFQPDEGSEQILIVKGNSVTEVPWVNTDNLTDQQLIDLVDSSI